MTCQRDESWISALLDGETPEAGAEEAERHLASCATCRQRLAELRTVQRLVRVPEVEPDPFFVTRFRARRDASEQSLASWRRVAVRLLLPAAAAAALVAVVSVRSGGHEPDSFWDLERHALGAGSPVVQSSADDDDLEPFLAAALGPREPVRPRVSER